MTAVAPSVPRAARLEGAAEADPGEWNALARRGFHLHRWFAVAQRCGWRPRHVALNAPGGLSAVVPAFLIGRAAYGSLHDRWFGPWRRAAERLRLRLWPVVAVCSPFGCTSEPLGDLQAVPDASLAEVFDLLEEEARRDRAVAVVWPDLDESAHRLVALARRRGYAAVYAGASARIATEWRSFEDYLASRSKAVRRTIRKELAALRAGGLRCERRTHFADAAAAMDALYRDAFRRRNRRDPPLARDFFAVLAAEPEPALWAHLTWAGDRLVGSSLNLATGGVLDGTLAAFAEDHLGGPAYYNDLVYAPVRIACEEGLAAVDLGPTALVPKVLRGAALRRRVTLVRGVTPAMHALLAGLGAAIGRRTARKERRRLAALGGLVHAGWRGA